MSEVRLTFAATDFGAVSEALINMGVSFRVDPLRAIPAEPAGPAPAAPRAQPRGKAASTRKKQLAARPQQQRETAPVSAADRLREAISRNQPSDSRPSSPPGAPAEDN